MDCFNFLIYIYKCSIRFEFVTEMYFVAQKTKQICIQKAIEKLSRIVDLMCVVVSKNYKYTDRSAVWSLDIQTMKITGYFILFCFLMRVIKIEVLTERDHSLSLNKLVVLLLPPTKKSSLHSAAILNHTCVCLHTQVHCFNMQSIVTPLMTSQGNLSH